MSNCRFDSTCFIPNASNSNGNGARKKQKRSSNGMLASNEKKSTEAILSLSSEIGQGFVSLTLPIRTVSELNSSDHWTKKHKRHKNQQKIVALALNPVKHHIPIPCNIHLVRYAPGKLNKHDNLPASMKYIVDSCCAIITGDFRPGRADDDERITFTYDQVKHESYGVKILFTF
jgi:hypothetical protein